LQQATAGKPLLLSPLKTNVCFAVENPASSGPHRIVKGLPEQQVCEAQTCYFQPCLHHFGIMEPANSGLQSPRDHVSGFLTIVVDPSLIKRIF